MGTPPPTELTLEQALRTAFASNRGLGIAQRRIEIARDVAAGADALGGPFVSAQINYSARNNDMATQSFGQTFKTADREDANAAVLLQMPVLDFGRNASAQHAARLGIGSAELASTRAREDLALAVKRAYYRVLEAEKLRSVVVESIALVEQQASQARDFLTQGLVARSDVLSVEVRLAERRQDLIRADVALKSASAALSRLLLADINRPLRLAEPPPPRQSQGEFARLRQAAIEQRGDLKALRLQVETAQVSVRAARAELYPQVSAFISYTHSSQSLLVNNEWATAGIGLKMNLYTAGAATAELARRDKLVLEAEDRYRDQEDNIVLELKQALLAAEQTADQLPVAAKGVELAEENLRIQRDRYAQGLVTITDVLIEDDNLSRARTGYFQAMYAYHSALAQLDNVVGKPFSTP
ncbi:MAG: TolC family protein [Candidatus Lambdaproteobacteria bacterium]|nr:TolC family protein [Candidatus Lambdaproteobacteria bacterium]